MEQFACYNRDKEEEIDAIAVFNRKGEMLPLYVKIGLERYKVLAAKADPDSLVVQRFFCKIEYHGRALDMQIFYYPQQQIWTVPREFIMNCKGE